MGKPLFSQNRRAIQTFGRKMVCRGMGKQLNRRKHVRDTGIFAGNGVSRHGKASVSAKPARDTDFWTEKGVSRHGKQLNGRKHVRDTGFLARNGVSLQGKASVFAKPACDTDFWPEKGVSRHGKQLNGRKHVHDWSMGPDESWGQLRFRGCDFLLSLRPFFEKLRSVV